MKRKSLAFVTCAIALLLVTALGVRRSKETRAPTAQSGQPMRAPRPRNVIQAASGLPTKLRIIIEQDYGEAKDTVLPIRRVTSRLLEAAGLKAVGSDSTDYEATLKVVAKGTADGALYMNAGFCYTGARMEGRFSWEVRNAVPLEKNFEGHVSPPDMIYGGRTRKTPSLAPFEAAFYLSDFFGKLAEVVRGNYGNDALLCYWLAALEEDFLLKLQAIKALGELRDSRATDALVEELVEDSRGEYVIEALAKIGQPAVEPLIAHLRSTDAENRALAAQILGKIGDARAVKPLTNALNDSNRDVQLCSAFALLKLGDSQKIDLLIAALRDPDGHTRWHAARLLGQAGDSRAIRPLIASLKESNASNVQEALEELTGEKFGSDAEKWLEWWEAKH